MVCQWYNEILTCRRVLFIMVVTGFIANSTLKTIFNITIVVMLKKTNETDTDLYDWDEEQKQNVLGVFFWGFALTKIPSGRLAETIGTRKVTGYSMLFASILTILTPIICNLNYYLVLVSRVAMGFLVGASWPAFLPLTSKWIPPNEQSVFLASISATSLGTGISYQCCGFIILSFGWQSVFYMFGTVALVWSIAWFYLIYDSPTQHPRITSEERRIIENSIDKNLIKQKLKVSQIPWFEIATSRAVWAVAAGQVAVLFGYLTLLSQLPSYLDHVFELKITENGTLSALPQWGCYICSLIGGCLADCLRKSGKISTINIRRLFQTLAIAPSNISLLVLIFFGNIPTVAIIFFTIASPPFAFSTAGHTANMLDISPNYAGTICGVVNTIAAFTPYLSTALVALFLKDGHSFEQWRSLFWVLFAVNSFLNIVYVVLCSTKLQSWDSKYGKRKSEEHEMESMVNH